MSDEQQKDRLLLQRIYNIQAVEHFVPKGETITSEHNYEQLQLLKIKSRKRDIVKEVVIFIQGQRLISHNQ